MKTIPTVLLIAGLMLGIAVAAPEVTPDALRPGNLEPTRFSLFAAVCGGLLLAVISESIHAWAGLVVFACFMQTGRWIAPEEFFKYFEAQSWVNQTTLGLALNKSVLIMLVIACALESLQKFIPYVHVFFNILNTVIKPVAGYILVIILSILHTHAPPDAVAQILGVSAGAVNLGLHVTKNVTKAATTIPVPVAAPAWGLAENAAAIIAVGLGTLVLCFT